MACGVPPLEAFFTSLSGGDSLRARVLEITREALAAGSSHRVDIHVMTFAFTERRIADLLEDAARTHPNVTVRIIADWTQGSPFGGRQVGRLAGLALGNLRVRYKKDQPYRWDASEGRLQWSYRTSRGLLHHKTLGILLDGHPWKLGCGSFNWTTKATHGYENLLVVSADTRESRDLMRRVELEFEAMWCDGRTTLSPEEAAVHYSKIVAEYATDPSKAPEAVVGLDHGKGDALRVLEDDACTLPDESAAIPMLCDTPGAWIAFNSRAPHEARSRHGYAECNRTQRYPLRKPSGSVKSVPLTLTTLALDTIFRARPGDTLKVAMYGLSSRVPEYSALLDAARRGVQIRVLLDARVADRTRRGLEAASTRERLPLKVKAGTRRMHQKYIVHPQTHSILIGTANMSRDAVERHSEQRVLVRNDQALAQSFLRDFDTIWNRLPGETG